MTGFHLILPFLFGTFLGSFLNVCIHRLPRGTSIVCPPSSCPTCKEPLRWLENIPILSYIFLAGRCGHCGSKISPRYLLVEILTGILTAFLWQYNSPVMNFSDVFRFIFQLTFFSLLLVITFIDLELLIVLDVMAYTGIILGLFYSLINHQFLAAGLTALGAATFFYVVRVLGEFFLLKEAMGAGDIKLAAMIGSFLGPQLTFVAIFLSFPIGLLVAGFLIAFHAKQKKEPIPFGPAMAISSFIAAFWGFRILYWYFLFHGQS